MMKVEEIKLRQSDGSFVEAEVEYKDGVLFVSPKVEKFKPKDGDVVVNGKLCKFVFIYKDNLTSKAYFYVGLNIEHDELFRPDGGHIGYVPQLRPATKKEKQKLFDKLAEEGWEWKADTKELVKLKWKSKDHEEVFVAGFTFFGEHPFCPFEDKAYSDSMQWRAILDRGWYFKTEEECQTFCDKLNQAIKSVKP